MASPCAGDTPSPPSVRLNGPVARPLRSRAKDRASPRLNSLKSAAIGKRTVVRMLSFTEAHKATLLLT